MTTAELIFELLEQQHRQVEITIDQAKNTAHLSALLNFTESCDMAQDGMFSYHYHYKDDSHLIIDDEGFIYCDEDHEIGIMCKTEFN